MVVLTCIMTIEVEHGKSCVYNINYHIVWCPKYRKKILTGKIKEFLEDQLFTICETKDWKISVMEVMPDHIHIFITTHPQYSPTAIVKVLKGVTGLRLFKKYPELKKEYWGGHIWSPSYYIGTAGTVSAETIKMYIKNQKGA